MDADLIDRVYQAAIVSETWPTVLQQIADRVGAVGALYMFRSPHHIDAAASPGIEQHVADYFAEGWGGQTEHAAALYADMPAGFRAEVDYHTPEEIALMPVHAQFMDPRGLIAGVGTVIQGAGDCMIQVSLEGFASHDAARLALPALDAVRPHLARSLSLSALRRSRTDVIVDSLELAGAAAAIVTLEGRLRSANRLFIARMEEQMIEIGGRLRFTDRFFNDQLAVALSRFPETGEIQSLALRDDVGGVAFAVHILPVTGRAREYCDAEGVLLLISDGQNACVPNADLLRTLFDLTPAEARLARHLVTGNSLDQAARLLGIQRQTARTQLRKVFNKTGVTRQAQLVLLLRNLSAPRANTDS